MILEACIESLSEAISAQKNGAHRLEICRDLDKDGLTPSIHLVEEITKTVSLPVKVMIRPVDGDFIYSKETVALMKREIEAFANMGINNFVVGMLTQDGSIHLEQLRNLCSSYPTSTFTFHKAIDQTIDIRKEISRLRTIQNLTSVLTSGGENTALAGADMIRTLITEHKNQLEIIAAGSITYKNINDLHARIQGEAYHGRKIVGP